MKTRKLKLLGLAAVAAASAGVVQAATIDYTVKLDDASAKNNLINVSGWVPADPGASYKFFGVYADVSTDTGGLANYQFSLNNSGIVNMYNIGPDGTFTKTMANARPVGFSAFHSANVEGNAVHNGSPMYVTGGQDITSAGPFVPAYGMGYQAGDLTALTPATYTFNDGASFVRTYGSQILLAAGYYNASYTANQVADWFVAGTTDHPNNGQFFTGTSVTTVGLVTAGLHVTGGAAPPAVTKIHLDAAPLGTNVATGGSVTVTHPSGYISEIDGLTSNGSNGAALVGGAGISAGDVSYAMLWTTGDANLILNDATLDLGGGTLVTSGAEYNKLKSLYVLPGNDTWEILIQYPAGRGIAGNSVSWDLGNAAGVQIDAVAVVPEPATLGLLSLGALGVLARRRRK